jgi:hypothetical protein
LLEHFFGSFARVLGSILIARTAREHHRSGLTLHLASLDPEPGALAMKEASDRMRGNDNSPLLRGGP